MKLHWPFTKSRSLIIVVFLFLVQVTLHGDTVRVATWNIKNYLSMDRTIDGVYYPDYPKPLAERKAMHALLKNVQPDILAIQEMGEEAFLKELQKDLKKEGLNYPYTSLLHGPDPERHLAVLSKYPFQKVYLHDRIAFKYGQKNDLVRRGVLEVVFEHNQIPWHLFIIHLKSQWSNNAQDPESKDFKKKEAFALRNFIFNRKANKYLLVGDFNATSQNIVMRCFLKKNNQTLGHLINAKDSRDEIWTFHQKNNDLYSRIDAIIASTHMHSHVSKASIEDILPHSHIASDHRLIYVDLNF